MKNKRKFGLIGYPLKHSFSPGYFAEKFNKEEIEDAVYDLYELERIDQFENLKRSEIAGLNVTIPYKEAVMPYLDMLSPEAVSIGAVNTIKFTDQGLMGYNTDCYGFKNSLTSFYGNRKPTRALVLGTGGASKAVRYVLSNLNIPFTIVSRQPSLLNYDELSAEHFDGEVLVVNTTPLGTWPDIDKAPNIPYQFLTSKHFLYDLVYNPEKTLFLKLGADQGAAIKNGYDMLKLQAEKSWEIWNG
ncbi:shikimate dehydrogenase family protein [Portibacter marinus]|uniref:shikimate dehydrogenase family protein n=1 Tax=Portibacter marinus TaxID=2898660 RepID=UPI001F3D8586|nr:shikimate dehydrogenase [Portibacter marinus]